MKQHYLVQLITKNYRLGGKKPSKINKRNPTTSGLGELLGFFSYPSTTNTYLVKRCTPDSLVPTDSFDPWHSFYSLSFCYSDRQGYPSDSCQTE